jgi:hypothetical protein
MHVSQQITTHGFAVVPHVLTAALPLGLQWQDAV